MALKEYGPVFGAIGSLRELCKSSSKDGFESNAESVAATLRQLPKPKPSIDRAPDK